MAAGARRRPTRVLLVAFAQRVVRGARAAIAHVRPITVVLAVMGLALVVRLSLLWSPAEQVPDTGVYLGLAELFLHGHHYPGAHPLNTGRTPGYPLLVAPLNYLPGSWEQVVVVFQHFVGVCIAGAVAALSALWFGRAAAALAGTTAALSPLAMGVERFITPDLVFGAFLLAGAALMMAGVTRAPRGMRWLIAAGAVFGIAAYVKPVAVGLCLAAVFPLAVATRDWRITLRGSVALGLTVIAIVTPWIVRNELLYDRATMSGIGDTTLFVRAFDEQQLAVPRDTADYRLAAAARQSALRADPTLRNTEYPVLNRLLARRMSYERASALMGGTARRAFLRAPSAFVSGAFDNLARLFDDSGTSSGYSKTKRELNQTDLAGADFVTWRLWRVGLLLSRLLRILSGHGLFIPLLLFVLARRPRALAAAACLGSVWLILEFTTAAIQLPTDPRYALSAAPLLWMLEAATVVAVSTALFRRYLDSRSPIPGA